MDSDDNVRRWAARWVGIGSGDPLPADSWLAEAVRVRLVSKGPNTSHWDADGAMNHNADNAVVEWFCDGPIAFMRAVKEVVDGHS